MDSVFVLVRTWSDVALNWTGPAETEYVFTKPVLYLQRAPTVPIRNIYQPRIQIWAILEKWVPYSQRYLFNAIPDTNHNANPTNPNRYSKDNPNPTNPITWYRCE